MCFSMPPEAVEYCHAFMAEGRAVLDIVVGSRCVSRLFCGSESTFVNSGTLISSPNGVRTDVSLLRLVVLVEMLHKEGRKGKPVNVDVDENEIRGIHHGHLHVNILPIRHDCTTCWFDAS